MTDEEWQAAQIKLVEDCPLLFRRGNETGFGFYFEIMSGWHEPVRKACLALEKIAERHEAPEDPWETPDPRPRAQQIKEKFGGLRLYYSGGGDEAGEIVRTAEMECGKLCERCGEEGSLRSDIGWITVLCEAHYGEAKRLLRERI